MVRLPLALSDCSSSHARPRYVNAFANKRHDMARSLSEKTTYLAPCNRLTGPQFSPDLGPVAVVCLAPWSGVIAAASNYDNIEAVSFLVFLIQVLLHRLHSSKCVRPLTEEQAPKMREVRDNSNFNAATPTNATKDACNLRSGLVVCSLRPSNQRGTALAYAPCPPLLISWKIKTTALCASHFAPPVDPRLYNSHITFCPSDA